MPPSQTKRISSHSKVGSIFLEISQKSRMTRTPLTVCYHCPLDPQPSNASVAALYKQRHMPSKTDLRRGTHWEVWSQNSRVRSAVWKVGRKMHASAFPIWRWLIADHYPITSIRKSWPKWATSALESSCKEFTRIYGSMGAAHGANARMEGTSWSGSRQVPWSRIVWPNPCDRISYFECWKSATTLYRRFLSPSTFSALGRHKSSYSSVTPAEKVECEYRVVVH